MDVSRLFKSRLCLTSVFFLLAFHGLFLGVQAAEKDEEALKILQAGRDALSTAHAKLLTGQIDCKLQITMPTQQEVHMEGTYSWDEKYQHFQGTQQIVTLHQGADGKLVRSPLPLEKVEWFRTPKEFCRHVISEEYRSADRVVPPDRLDRAPNAVDLGLFWFDYSTTKVRLEDILKIRADETAATTVDDDGRTVIHRGSPHFQATYTFDPKQGGLLVEHRYMPQKNTSYWNLGSYSWAKHSSGIWYPEAAEHKIFPHGSWENAHYHHKLTVTRFEPRSGLSPKRLTFKAFDLKPGTYVTETLPSGHRNYVVGGESGKRAIFEGRLKSAAQKTKKSGFADPKRGKEKP